MNQKRAPHRTKNRFYNMPGERLKNVFWQSIYMYIQSYAQRIAARIRFKNSDYALINHPEPYTFQQADHVTWIGHATFLIHVSGYTILTDPIFGDLTFLLQRSSAPGIPFPELPHIDIVVLSHNHRDHMDGNTLHALYSQTKCHFYVPFGDKAWFDARGMGDRVTECTWWQEINHQGLPMTFLPAWHWSQRGLFDRNKSLWGSWMIDDRIYFAGDTAYSNHFKEIAQHFPSIEVALLPIGPCEPRAWMRATHMDAADAGKAFLDLKAQTFIPMHWGTYGFGIDDLMLPVTRLKQWWPEQKFETSQRVLAILACGQSYMLAGIKSVAPFIARKGAYAVR